MAVKTGVVTATVKLGGVGDFKEIYDYTLTTLNWVSFVTSLTIAEPFVDVLVYQITVDYTWDDTINPPSHDFIVATIMSLIMSNPMFDLLDLNDTILT